ncbi:Rrf2 family transcriptional regulator [Lentilactobacillus sp. Marseille-Q4993]|uniref:Rrf2 family transcriptional regulator n=1 Tax=Lentilactobacillus sp. Marseille-Q4993 TaxID=3039492 RepID=UPI0024BC5FC3|nr:Rrf2 family transcriptional regulator [Lentilactobacillus sp. Marseille-Q4993]
MKYSHKLSDAVHILAFIEINQGGNLSSQTIASSIESNPSLIRRMMSELSQAGLITTQAGKSSPKLSRSAKDISLLDIYQIIEGSTPILHVDDATNPDCVIGANIQDTLTKAYEQVQNAANNEMHKISLQSIIDGILLRSSQSN